jgi:hypothetical protein
MASFLWTLEWSGVTITLIGLGREHWLASRHRWGRPVSRTR